MSSSLTFTLYLVNPIVNKYTELVHTLTGDFKTGGSKNNSMRSSLQDESKGATASFCKFRVPSYNLSSHTDENNDFEHILLNHDYNRAIYSFLDNFLNKIEEFDPVTIAQKEVSLQTHLISKKREWIAKIEK